MVRRQFKRRESEREIEGGGINLRKSQVIGSKLWFLFSCRESLE